MHTSGKNRAPEENERSFAQLNTNPLFKDAVKGKPLSPSIIEIGNQSADRGRNAGIVILVCVASAISLIFLSGQIEFRPPYLATGYALTGLGILAAFLFWQNQMGSYFLVLSCMPLTATIIFAIGFNDTAGFFINGLAMSILVASLIIDKNRFFIIVGISLIVILFQFSNGPETVFGPIPNSYSQSDRLTVGLSWLFIFVSIIQVNLNNFQFFIQQVFDLNHELDLVKSDLLKKNTELDQINETLEEKIAERTEILRLALQSANAESEAKTAFLATMSHELRTPLNAILGYNELNEEILADIISIQENGRIEDVLEDLEEMLQTSGHISSRGKALLTLIQDILDISQIETGDVPLEVTRVDLAQFLTEIDNLTAHSIKASNNRLTISQSIAEKHIQTDIKNLRQILLNLLDNATKFTENGHISLHVSELEQDQLCFTVTDTGIGIPEEDLERIFDPFVQVEKTFNRAFEGAGLGLAICRQLTVLLGGNISVESVVGKGSVFKLTIPSLEHVDLSTDEPSTFFTG